MDLEPVGVFSKSKLANGILKSLLTLTWYVYAIPNVVVSCSSCILFFPSASQSDLFVEKKKKNFWLLLESYYINFNSTKMQLYNNTKTTIFSNKKLRLNFSNRGVKILRNINNNNNIKILRNISNKDLIEAFNTISVFWWPKGPEWSFFAILFEFQCVELLFG